MSNVPSKNDLAELPIIRLIALAYTIVSFIVIPLGFLVIVCTIPGLWRKFRAAVDPVEKIYWRLRLVGYLLIAYAGLVTILLIHDGFVLSEDSWHIGEQWPSLAHYWYGDGDDTNNLCLEVITIFAAGSVAVLMAKYFGQENDDGSWYMPEWLVYQRHINEVRGDIDVVRNADPRLIDGFESLAKSTQTRKINAWKKQLDVAEQRLINVKKTYRRL